MLMEGGASDSAFRIPNKKETKDEEATEEDDAW